MAFMYLVHGVILGLRKISHEPQYCYPQRKTSLKYFWEANVVPEFYSVQTLQK